MSKSTVTRLFIGGVVAMLAALILALVALWVAFANGVVTVGGESIVSLNGGSAAWTVLGLVFVGFIAFTGGAIAGLIAWIGALLNTAQHEDKTWFVVLLVTGLLSFGLIGMIIYLVAAPDSERPAPPRPQQHQFPGATAA